MNQVTLAHDGRSGELIAVARYPGLPAGLDGAIYFGGRTVLPAPDDQRVYAAGEFDVGKKWTVASYATPTP